MSQIRPKFLRLAASFIKLRRPSAAAGADSQAHLCHVFCEEGRLAVRCTDNRFFFQNRFPSSGGAGSRNITVLAREIDNLWPRLKSLGSLKQTATSLNYQFQLAFLEGNLLRLSRAHFEITLAAVPMANPFPSLAIPTDAGAWSSISAQTLRDGLAFLSGRTSTDDPRDRSQNCTFYADGVGLAGLANYGMLLFKDPAVRFELRLRNHDARRLLVWIKCLDKVFDRPTEALHIAEFVHAGGVYYCLRDPDGNHTVCFPAATESFSRARYDNCRQRPVTLVGNVARQHLRSLAFQAQKGGSLIFSLGGEGQRRWLDVRTATSLHGNSMRDRVRFEPVGELPPLGSPLEFELPGSRLAQALSYISGDRLTLTCFGSNGVLSFRQGATEQPTLNGDAIETAEDAPNDQDETETNEAPSYDQPLREVFIVLAPPSPPSSGSSVVPPIPAP